MKKLLKPHAVRLEFEADSLVQLNLSGATFAGQDLWVSGDEACGLDRLTRLAPCGDEALRFGQATNFPLSSLIDLPGPDDGEADIEGMALDGDYLWIVGSHGLKRKNAKPDRTHEDNARRLAKLSLDPNRLLLARIPVVHDAAGQSMLVDHAADGRRAMRLEGDDRDNQLTHLLRKDPHFGPFMTLPGKDNGFDIEGLAILGDTMLLGLRGPVLRGWAGLLQVQLRPSRKDLHLAPLPGTNLPLRKHFLNLGGRGVRDLHLDGDDLYILAGPTMVLDGDIHLYRWPQARQHLQGLSKEAVMFWPDLVSVCQLPHAPGADRAEAFCAVPPEMLPGSKPSWLALYDAPSPARHPDEHTIFGDLLLRPDAA